MLEKLQKFMWISGLSRLVNLPMRDKQLVNSSTRPPCLLTLLLCLLDKQPVPLSCSPVPKFFSEYFV